jgi:hypothetical protein
MRVLVHRIICVFALFCGTLLHAVELIGKPQVASTTNGAVIQWRTDVDCGTRLQYGLNPAALDRKAEGVVSNSHQVTLEGLAPGTTYHYSLGSARAQLATGTFATSGSAPAATPQPSIMRRVLDAITPDKKAAPDTAPTKTPPARQTWGKIDSLQDHFDRHGRDFGSKSPEDYAAQAWLFLQRARTENLPMKLDDTDSTVRIFDPQTGAFAAYNGVGKTKTFFKPESSTYWQRQPGRAVKSSELRFLTR